MEKVSPTGQGDASISKSNRTLVFVAMIVTFWGAGAWQMKANKEPAAEEDVEVLLDEGDCEAKYARAWSSTGGGRDGMSPAGITRQEVQNIRAICRRERKLEEQAAKRQQ